MTLKLSTDLRNKMMTNGDDGGQSLAEIMKGGIVDVWAGVRPANCDATEPEPDTTTKKLFRLINDSGSILNAGSLVIGQAYRIVSAGTGADFDNVGGEGVGEGEDFTATGTTPTSWGDPAAELKAIGISFGNAVDGKISRNPGETWKGVGLVNGTASWFRAYASASDLGLRTSEDPKIRFEGQCSVFGGQMNLVSLSVTEGQSQTIDNFDVTLPAQ